ncbi:hypothetical protein ElyMa_006329200 [Elysia marginata]|uniref:Secreted protein n=1 Tax=Elysia marginata TaxID=1093978 RepID=A0AAV4HI69_9GAST|nr:hypothetical protein ElyMa_006329200 [Elysia marginata]
MMGTGRAAVSEVVVAGVQAAMVAAGSVLATGVDASDAAKPAVCFTSFFDCKCVALLTNQASSSALVFVLGLAPRLLKKSFKTFRLLS